MDFSMFTPEFVEKVNLKMDESDFHWTDYEKLGSALSSYMYYEDDLDKLCSIFRDIVMNHAFSNANKRTASLILTNALEDYGYAIDDDFMASLCLDTINFHYEVKDISNLIKAYLDIENL